MKRVCCLLLAALLLLAIFGCKKKEEEKTKKDQVVHVGETVQYGDIAFTFDKQGVDYYTAYIDGNYGDRDIFCIFCVKLTCSYSGDESMHVASRYFKAYVDGKEIGEKNYAGSSTSLVGREATRIFKESGCDFDQVEVSLKKDRSGDLWIGGRVPIGTNKVELDYTDSDYSKGWGKVTFVVDIPEAPTKDDALIGTWYNEEQYTYETRVFNGNGRGSYSKWNGYSIQDGEFEYSLLAEGTLMIGATDGSKHVWHYTIQDDKLEVIEDGVYTFTTVYTRQ